MNLGKVKVSYYNGSVGYNKPKTNERRIELGLAEAFINRFDGLDSNIVEVGAVCPYYWPTDYPVIDQGDLRATHKINAINYDYTGKDVLSISTVEHMGTGEYNCDVEEGLAARFLDKVFAEANNYLITIPIGAQQHIDELVFNLYEKGTPMLFLERDEENNWHEITKLKATYKKYNKPYLFANCICVISNWKDLYLNESDNMGNLYLVIGPISSGTRLFTKLLVTAGCVGESGHAQAFDSGIPRGHQNIVWRRSVPHFTLVGYPNIKSMLEVAGRSGYTLKNILVVDREWNAAIQSANNRHGTQGIEHTLKIYRKSVVDIYRQIYELNLQDKLVVGSFEALSGYPRKTITFLSKYLELPTDKMMQMAGQIRDENRKFYT